MNEQPESGKLPATVREIQALTRPEGISLARIWGESPVHDEVTADQLTRNVNWLIKSGGRAWIIGYDATIAGYASLVPTPGLPGLYELDGFIAVAYQRQGMASLLLRTMTRRLANSNIRQIFHSVASMSSPAAQFLVNNGFFVEHEERQLILDNFRRLPQGQLDDRFSLRTYGMQRSIRLFRQLYDESFAGQAWYQPYESDLEVAGHLSDSDDLLFLEDGGRPIGFLWLRWPGQQTAEFEPLGLIPAYRGKGLGQQLLLAGLQHAQQQGALQARVGVWHQNTPALALYERLGFRMTGDTIYLAYDL